MHRILIVDDERDVRDSVKCVLDLAGYLVHTAENATDAMEQLARIPADLVITDIIMPKVNGVEVVESILREFPAMRILVISGGGNFDTGPHNSSEILTTAYLTEALAAGAHHVLNKPFDSGELLQAVALIMSAGKREDRLS